MKLLAVSLLLALLAVASANGSFKPKGPVFEQGACSAYT
jgi:hypothetical protein